MNFLTERRWLWPGWPRRLAPLGIRTHLTAQLDCLDPHSSRPARYAGSGITSWDAGARG